MNIASRNAIPYVKLWRNTDPPQLGEAANAFKVFIPPGLLIFYVLRFHFSIMTIVSIYCVNSKKPTARKRILAVGSL